MCRLGAGAATRCLLGALAHGPPTSESTGLFYAADRHLNVSQSLQIKYAFRNDELQSLRLIQKDFDYVLGLALGHLSDLAHACIAGCCASRCLSGDRDKHFAM